MELEKVKVKRIIGPTPSGAAVLLGNDIKTFVVFVGFFEAAALIREVNREVPARPLTHELLQNVFLGFDVRVKKVIISTIIENTFCATLVLEQGVSEGDDDWTPKRNEVRIDARPSDCFVLALKNKVDLYVTREVLDQVQDVTKMTEEVENNLASGNFSNLGFSSVDLEAPSDEPSSPESFLGEAPDFSTDDDDDDEDEDEDDYEGFKP